MRVISKDYSRWLRLSKKSRDKDEAKRLLRRLKTHVQLKGTKEDPVQERRFWLGLSNMNPEARAINFVNKVRNASKEDKARLLKDFKTRYLP